MSCTNIIPKSIFCKSGGEGLPMLDNRIYADLSINHINNYTVPAKYTLTHLLTGWQIHDDYGSGGGAGVIASQNTNVYFHYQPALKAYYILRKHTTDTPRMLVAAPNKSFLSTDFNQIPIPFWVDTEPNYYLDYLPKDPNFKNWIYTWTFQFSDNSNDRSFVICVAPDPERKWNDIWSEARLMKAVSTWTTTHPSMNVNFPNYSPLVLNGKYRNGTDNGLDIAGMDRWAITVQTGGGYTISSTQDIKMLPPGWRRHQTPTYNTISTNTPEWPSPTIGNLDPNYTPGGTCNIL